MRKDIETILHGIVGSVTLAGLCGLYFHWSLLALIAVFQMGTIFVLSFLYLEQKKKVDEQENLRKLKSFSGDGIESEDVEAPVNDENIGEPETEQQPAVTGPDRLIGNYCKLKSRLLELVDEVKDPTGDGSDAKWSIVLERKSGNYVCRVEKRVGGDFFFRVSCDFESSAEEAFDYLSDIEGRNRWDEITESSGFVEKVSNKSSIVYTHSRGVWSTSPRDCLAMSFLDRLQDGRYCHITQSVEENPKYQPRKGSVRMKVRLAGLVIGPHSSKNPKMCHCVQIIDGDLGGWLPPSIVALVSTQAFPLSMGRVNSYLTTIENPRTVSKLIEASERKGTSSVSKPADNPFLRPPRSLFTRIMHVLRESQPALVVIILILTLKQLKAL